MDAQPNAGRLAEAFAAASHEIALVPNLPPFDYGQHILQAIQAMNTNIINLTANIITLIADINALNLGFDLELRMRADSLNHTARVYNSHISSRNTPLRVLYDQRNRAVAGFPPDLASLRRLSGNTLTTLLNVFQLPTNGTVEAKKRRFREFVGLVIDA